MNAGVKTIHCSPIKCVLNTGLILATVLFYLAIIISTQCCTVMVKWTLTWNKMINLCSGVS